MRILPLAAWLAARAPSAAALAEYEVEASAIHHQSERVPPVPKHMLDALPSRHEHDRQGASLRKRTLNDNDHHGRHRNSGKDDKNDRKGSDSRARANDKTPKNKEKSSEMPSSQPSAPATEEKKRKHRHGKLGHKGGHKHDKDRQSEATLPTAPVADAAADAMAVDATTSAATTVDATKPATTTAVAAEACPFCPAGIPNPTQPLPTNDGSTCGSAAFFALSLTADDTLCSTVQLAEGLCCPEVPVTVPATEAAMDDSVEAEAMTPFPTATPEGEPTESTSTVPATEATASPETTAPPETTTAVPATLPAIDDEEAYDPFLGLDDAGGSMPPTPDEGWAGSTATGHSKSAKALFSSKSSKAKATKVQKSDDEDHMAKVHKEAAASDPESKAGKGPSSGSSMSLPHDSTGSSAKSAKGSSKSAKSKAHKVFKEGEMADAKAKKVSSNGNKAGKKHGETMSGAHSAGDDAAGWAGGRRRLQDDMSMATTAGCDVCLNGLTVDPSFELPAGIVSTDFDLPANDDGVYTCGMAMEYATTLSADDELCRLVTLAGMFCCPPGSGVPPPTLPTAPVGTTDASVGTPAQPIELTLRANATLNSITGYDDLIYFEPTLSGDTVCAEECPCLDPSNPDACDCGLETVCGGTVPLDLSGGNEMRFRWEASDPDDEDAKLIALTGKDRTRVELRLHVPDCQSTFQGVRGDDLSFELDDAGLDATQRFVYNPEESFLTLGTCDGCAQECEIFARVQFDPDEDGVLDMKFRSLNITAGYDPQNVVEGEQEYQWATDSYNWIRQPEVGSIELLPAFPDNATTGATEAMTPFPTPTPVDETSTTVAATAGTTTAAPETTAADTTAATEASTTVAATTGATSAAPETTVAASTSTSATEVTCSFCPRGVDNPDLALPTNDGATCAMAAEFAATLDASDELCEVTKIAEQVCCPDGDATTDATEAMTPFPTSTPAQTCSCSPIAYRFALNFSGNCDASSATGFDGEGVDGSVCFFFQGGDPDEDIDPDNIFGGPPRRLQRVPQGDKTNQRWSQVVSEMDFSSHVKHAKEQARRNNSRRAQFRQFDTTPVTVTSVTFLESDTSMQMNIINQDSTYFDIAASDGDVLDFTSISSLLDPSIPIDDQLDSVPGGVMMVLFGTNAAGEIIRNTIAWGYDSGYCGGEPLETGDAIGWVSLEGHTPPIAAFCDAVTAAPTNESTAKPTSPPEVMETIVDEDKSPNVASKSSKAKQSKSAKASSTSTDSTPTPAPMAKSVKMEKSEGSAGKSDKKLSQKENGGKSDKEMSGAKSAKTSAKAGKADFSYGGEMSIRPKSGKSNADFLAKSHKGDKAADAKAHKGDTGEESGSKAHKVFKVEEMDAKAKKVTGKEGAGKAAKKGSKSAKISKSSGKSGKSFSMMYVATLDRPAETLAGKALKGGASATLDRPSETLPQLIEEEAAPQPVHSMRYHQEEVRSLKEARSLFNKRSGPSTR